VTGFGKELRLVPRTLWDAARLYRLAPVIPLFAALVEFAQHVVEIRLGMFDGRDAFRALGADPMRMAFGYAKVAALCLSMLLAARFWALRDVAPGDCRAIAWRPLLIGFAATIVMSIPTAPGLFDLSVIPTVVIGLAFSLLTLPTLALMAGGLLGVPDTVARVYRRGWGQGGRIVLLSLASAIPLQALHYANHILVLGRPLPLVWGVMTWDALLVGVMAAALGTALYHGYKGPASEQS
jgi:hypothetical protein